MGVRFDMAKRLNVWNDEVLKILNLGIGDEFVLEKRFNFSGKNSMNAIDHLNRNMPVGLILFVAEDISKYHQVVDKVVNFGTYQECYSADAPIYSLNGWERECTTYPASKMPKVFSRFTVQVVGHEKIFNDSTSWFSAYIRFKILESVPCRLSSIQERKR